MRQRKKERLKDILIDHVYDFCFNEKVQRVEVEGIKLTYDDPEQLKRPESELLLEQIKKSKKIRGYYTTRETEYCRIITENNYLHKTMIEKLKVSGFSKGKNLIKSVENTQDFLIARSYFARNNPLKDEIKLTEKGIKHYLEGKSFEDDYILRRNSNIAITISIVSIIIALIAIFT